MSTTIESESWVDDMLALAKSSTGVHNFSSSLVKSIRTQRRATVVWMTRNQVKLLWSEYSYSIISEESFKRNYIFV